MLTFHFIRDVKRINVYFQGGLKQLRLLFSVTWQKRNREKNKSFLYYPTFWQGYSNRLYLLACFLHLYHQIVINQMQTIFWFLIVYPFAGKFPDLSFGRVLFYAVIKEPISWQGTNGMFYPTIYWLFSIKKMRRFSNQPWKLVFFRTHTHTHTHL